LNSVSDIVERKTNGTGPFIPSAHGGHVRKATQHTLMEDTKWGCGVFVIHQGNEKGHDLWSCSVRTIIDRREFRKGNFIVNNRRLLAELPASVFRVSSPWSARAWSWRH
jgi:hypothetical protein